MVHIKDAYSSAKAYLGSTFMSLPTGIWSAPLTSKETRQMTGNAIEERMLSVIMMKLAHLIARLNCIFI